MKFNNEKIKKLMNSIEKQLVENDDLYALISLRTLLEEIVDSFDYDDDMKNETLFNKIEYLKNNGYLDKDEIDTFHKIRMSGNKAVHENECELSEPVIRSYYSQLLSFIKKNENKTIKKKNKKSQNSDLIKLVILIIALIIYWLFF